MIDKRQESIIYYSDKILEYLLNFKEKHSDFTFSLRQRNSTQSTDVKRLESGMWFQGSHYIYVPLFKRGDKAQKIKTVGFVINFDKEGKITASSVKISFKWGVDDPKEQEFHRRLAAELRIELNAHNHGDLFFDDPYDIFRNLEYYLTDVRTHAISLLREYKLSNQYMISETEFQKVLSRINEIRMMRKETMVDDVNIKNTITTMVNAPLNQILYGPPGTGKTYNTINLALEIIGVDISNKKREEIKEFFDKKIKDGQIAFTTFHQSMSYEDFIEGIKPSTKAEKVIYHVNDGIFKKVVKNALIEYLKSDQKQDNEDSYDTVFEDYITSIKSLVGKRQPTYTTKTGVELMLTGITENAILVRYLWRDRNKTDEGKQIFTVSKEKLKKVLMEGIVPEKVKNLKEQLHPLIGHIHCELFAVYKHFFEFVVKNRGEIEVVSFDYKELDFKDVKEQFDLLDKQIIRSKKVNPYILIIDEINRGNVSQIFGELITLLEPDKRIGEQEEIVLKLPYSQDEFGVPPNVYVIGTMNTADRSVEALDTALRRRFSFIEILPEPELLSDIIFTGFNLSEVLKVINQRIEALLDRDHTIGHSYFIKLKSGDVSALRKAFRNCIVPLLQEYFYGNYEKIALVLGRGFMTQKSVAQFAFAEFEDIDVPELPANYELIADIDDIEGAVRTLLNR